MTDNTKAIEKLFEVKAHLGHKTNRVHPKAKKYIYSVENGVSIIDLTLTEELLRKAKEYMGKLAIENKIVLVVVTKKIASQQIQALCHQYLVHFVSTKWPAGLLTNFETIKKNIKKLNQLKKEKSEDAWQKFVKHDRVKLEKELAKLEKAYGGLAQLTKLPDALLIVDIKKEKNAVIEALKNNIPMIAIIDTNVDPDKIDFPIPANDDSLSSVEYIVKELVEAYAKNVPSEKSVKSLKS